MAVSLPSDLIADVMRNADPARRQSAVARLQSLGDTGSAFTTAVAQAAPAPWTDQGQAPPPGLRHVASAARNSAERGGAEAYRGFEQMVLRNLFETLLPEQDSGAFGGGPSAGVWRSMAADQLAGVYAEKGGIGIARMLGSTAAASAPGRESQWPYFSLHPLQALGSEG